jgi:WD40 repeat protein
MDGGRITFTGRYKGVKLWDTSSCAKTWSMSGDSTDLYVAVFAPNDKLIALQLINNGRSPKMVQADSGQELATFSGHEEELADVDFSPNGHRLITSGKAGLIKIWDISTGQVLMFIKTGFGKIEATAISPDGNVIAAIGESDKTISVFRAID